MLSYIIRRILIMIPTLVAVSMVAFMIIDLPPGDWLSFYVAQLRSQDIEISEQVINALRERYGFDQPLPLRYLKWMWGVLHGDFGQSFQYQESVNSLIGERLGLTLVIALSTVMFTWIVALPIGIYSAVRRYSIGDYLASFIGFIGIAVPNFLLALIIMYIAFKQFGYVVGGLFSPEYADAPWSWGRVVDLMKRIWVPVVIVGIGGTAGLIRTMRANLIDELHKPYVMTARAKGLPEWRLILKYPVRLAMNPFVSGLAFLLPNLISGGLIVAMVLNLPTTGPMLLASLRAQDMYLAGSFILLLSALTVIGTLISDILLAWIDPRIRFE